MLASRRWLEAFLRQPIDSRDAADKLAMLGAPVDSITPIGEELAPFVVGLVTDVKPHPNADKLRVTSVDDGSGTPLQVVCGAPNVTAGHRYPLARVGVTMPGPDGFKLKKSKLRGETSEGMLCSARELGLGTEHDGIFTLDTDAAPGTPLLDVLALSDDQLEVDVTPNRPDLLGHKGIARELAIAYNVPYRLPEIAGLASIDLPTPVRYSDETTVGGIRLAIADRGCDRFLAAVIRGIKVGPSPDWLVERIEAVGLRSINNVVDVTNYVMLELNQPMHAYDAATLKGPAVVVRAARDGGETLTTLDGVERKVPPGTLVIADAERVIGVAGVMGGADTEVSDTTTDLFLECAFFDASRVRAGKNAINLSTDASQRFERGTDRWGAVDAFRRAVRLLVTVGGGKLDGDTVDCFPAPSQPPRIFLRPARVKQVLGVDLEWKEIERCLVAIGSTVVSKPDDGRIAVDVPGWRPDLVAEIDLVEEIARVHGYDNIPTELRAFRPGLLDDDPEWSAISRVRDGLASLGLSEAMSLSMRAEGGELAPKIANPLSADHGVLRDSLLPALVTQVEANWAAHTGDIRLFEVGTVFTNKPDGGRPHEETRVAFAVTGARHPHHWSAGRESTWGAWDARWVFEQMVALASPRARVEVRDDGWVALVGKDDVIGSCGPLRADSPRWAYPLFGGEVVVVAKPKAHAKYQALPTHPPIARDLALLLALEQSADELVKFLRQRGRKLGVEAVDVVDEFRGGNLPPNKRSVAVRLVFRAADRTLKDAEVDKAVGRLVSMMEREFDVTLRTA
jgi:phenylalanyl-tRNA synthetase beta chain